MKYLLLIAVLVFAQIVDGQTILLQYKGADGNLTKPEEINKDSKLFRVNLSPPITTLTVEVKDLPAKTKLIFMDVDDDDLKNGFGVFDGKPGKKEITSGTNLDGREVRIVLEDEKGVTTNFAKIRFLAKLPAATIDVLKVVTPDLVGPLKPCDACDYTNNYLIYDFAKNNIDYKRHTSWTNGRPVVGFPYSFQVKNINPFRDSVIISNETQDYNTDVPDLFTQAFFSPGVAHAANAQMPHILADVFAMGEQLKKIESDLKNSRECTDICDIIQKTKEGIEKHFTDTYKFFDSKKDLITNLQDNLQGINPVYKDSVAHIIDDFRAFANTKTYYIYNIPQVQNADAYIFTLSVLPKTGAQLYTVVDHQLIKVHTVGGFKVDFSSGLFITNLVDQKISLKPDSSIIHTSYGGDSIIYNRRNQIIQQTAKHDNDFGVASFLHFYPRLTPTVNVSLTLGAGLSIGPNPSIKYLGGVSLLLGRNGRLCLTYGAAAGFVDELADTYQNGQYTSITDKSQVIKRTFHGRSFASVSFSIPLFKSKVVTGADKFEDTSKDDSATATPKKDGGADATKKE